MPNAPFVAASLGQSTLAPTCTGNCGGGILQAMLNVAKKVKNVATIDSHPLSMVKNLFLLLFFLVMPRQVWP